MLNLTANTTTNPLTRIRNHFSSIVNGSLSPSSRKEVTVKEFANFLGIDTTALYRAEEGLIYEIPAKILHGFSVYLAQLHYHYKWPALTAWFEQSRLDPKKYKFFAANNSVTINGKSNPLWWEETDLVLYKNCEDYLVLLWELHVLDSLNAAEYPWDKNSNLVNDLPNITPFQLNLLLSDITAFNGRDNTAYCAARIIKMSSWPLEKYLRDEMVKTPAQFVKRIKLWSEIQYKDIYSRQRRIIAGTTESVLNKINKD